MIRILLAPLLLLWLVSVELYINKKNKLSPSNFSELFKLLLKKNPNKKQRAYHFVLVCAFAFSYWEGTMRALLEDSNTFTEVLIACAGILLLVFPLMRLLKDKNKILTRQLILGFFGLWSFFLRGQITGLIFLIWLLFYTFGKNKTESAIQ